MTLRPVIEVQDTDQPAIRRKYVAVDVLVAGFEHGQSHALAELDQVLAKLGIEEAR